MRPCLPMTCARNATSRSTSGGATMNRDGFDGVVGRFLVGVVIESLSSLRLLQSPTPRQCLASRLYPTGRLRSECSGIARAHMESACSVRTTRRSLGREISRHPSRRGGSYSAPEPKPGPAFHPHNASPELGTPQEQPCVLLSLRSRVAHLLWEQWEHWEQAHKHWVFLLPGIGNRMGTTGNNPRCRQWERVSCSLCSQPRKQR